jgi:CRISPR-associated protein (TIGR03986 family)
MRNRQAGEPRRSFHNPYNFIPTPSRSHLPRGHALGDAAPAGHSRYADNLWSGTVGVKLVVETPLLVPDSVRSAGDEIGPASNLTLRLDRRGKPVFPVTSFKGALRSAYETVTNSRFGVVAQYTKPYGYRRDFALSAKLVPARIESTDDGWIVQLLPGDLSMRADGTAEIVRDVPATYAAWLHRYMRGKPEISRNAVRYSNGQLPEHGDCVDVELFWQQRDLPGRRLLWHPFVTKIECATGAPPSPGRQRGWVCITGANAENKHDERVFLLPRQNAGSCRAPLRDAVRNAWSRLTNGVLRHGALAYAAVAVDPAKQRVEVLKLFPVMLSRDVFDFTPDELLDPTLRPADALARLSPADRVFGWVNSYNVGAGAYRGQTRIREIVCVTEPSSAIRRFDPPLRLANLGAPLPQQGRFYVGDHRGRAQHRSRDLTKERAGYNDRLKRLRGRKIYPHHRINDPQRYWNPAVAEGQERREYVRPPSPESSAFDRTLDAWIAPGTEFTALIDVVNLSAVELGALLWLLSLDGFLRIGAGKPLGFGSVRASLSGVKLRDGRGWRERYRSFGPSESSTASAEPGRFIAEFKRAVEDGYKESFERNPFIAAFLRATSGFEDGLPLHYPRAASAPASRGKIYEWFLANDRPQNRYALADLMDDSMMPDPGLPYLDRFS